MASVVIRGDGVAACCCAHLLNKASFPVSLQRTDRPRLPAIMLGDHALALIRDIFGQPDLFRDAPRVRKRMVAWGPDAKMIAVDHSAVVVSEELLLEKLSPGAVGGDECTEPAWTIHASRPLPAPTQEYRFGARTASAVAVGLKSGSDHQACWIESLATGWLFLIPNAPGSAWLLSVGSTPDALLAGSRMVAGQIDRSSAPTGEFPAYPRIVSPLAGPGWLACGTAAMAFDPLCGDGTAHAIREAILASAVIRAIKSGAAADVLAHYEARLTAGFRRHLELCREFYKSGAGGTWWESELELIEQGIAWCDGRLRSHGEFRYQLRDFELHALR